MKLKITMDHEDGSDVSVTIQFDLDHPQLLYACGQINSFSIDGDDRLEDARDHLEDEECKDIWPKLQNVKTLEEMALIYATAKCILGYCLGHLNCSRPDTVQQAIQRDEGMPPSLEEYGIKIIAWTGFEPDEDDFTWGRVVAVE